MPEMAFGRGPWRLRADTGEDLIVRLSTSLGTREQDAHSEYPAAFIRSKLRAWLSDVDDLNRKALFDIYRDVTGYDAPAPVLAGARNGRCWQG
jgi:hypothetical protein